MKRTVAAALFAALSFSVLAPSRTLAADPAPGRKAAEELLLLLQLDKNLDTMMQSMGNAALPPPSRKGRSRPRRRRRPVPRRRRPWPG